MKGKKETIGVIKGTDLLKKTRGISRANFRSGFYKTEKDRPRDKNWEDWIDDDICWCSDSKCCDNLACFRHLHNRVSTDRIFTCSALMNTEYCLNTERGKK